MAMEFICACNSQKGPNKSVDQDSVLLIRAKTNADSEIVFAVICDGVGGMKKGELTSALVTVAFEQWFDEHMAALQRQADIENGLFDEWLELIKQLHTALKKSSKADGIQSGTTLEVLLLLGGKYYICHVGDCRVYALGSELEQLTHDHTYVQREVDAGRMTPEQARKDKNQNLLLQCIGAGSDDIQPDFLSGQVEKGQMFLLCCDGQRRRISSAEIKQQLLMAHRSPTPKKLTDTLCKLAALCRKRGEKDDISAILVAQNKANGLLWLLGPLVHKKQQPAGGELCVVQRELLIHAEELPVEGNSNKNETLG